MARLRTNVLKWGTKDEGPNTYKHGRRGALDDAYWDEDELVDYPSKKKFKKPRKKREPCRVTGDAHVWVWTTEYIDWWDRSFFEKNGFYRYEYKVCCGCLTHYKHYKKGHRKTKEYARHLEKLRKKTGYRWF